MYLLVKFVDQTFHVVQRVNACSPLEIYWHSLGRRAPRLRTTGQSTDDKVDRYGRRGTAGSLDQQQCN